MRKLFAMYLIIFSCSNLYSQIINIPDTNFKSTLLLSNTTNYIAQNSQNANIVIDINNNGEIEQSEALQVFYLYPIGYGISNLTGIEYFTNLVWLGVDQNQLTSIDLSQLTNLETFGCSQNQITSVDFTGLLQLKRVAIRNNLITSLDFTNNPLLTDLTCANNPNLTTIKIKNNLQHLFGIQSYWNQCWNNLPNLNYICADDFEINALQTFLIGCGVTQAITIDSSCVLNVPTFDSVTFSVYPNPSSDIFTVEFIETINNATIKIYNILGQEIYTDFIKNVSFKEINLEKLSKGTYFLKLKFSDSRILTKSIIKI